ncbi:MULTISPECIES: MOSC domain-containing protein [unclassified Paracoccus (in: a-proteobacteria)]|uniref:MOSC domain-containing protein n=1 Tax=unclassified Paracoccus (in: a-proteobacteria) TaxID=2688777 RepID=UPI0012B2F875|nr:MULTISPECIES: MOSC domain-containing protein [unclassified Paracoccus (in: a-proteobacteria)]UXU76239.1 MOSC domain-containing protein [Paracoccus sp. SMMA_5]UXU80763.1 MOSC domain-containing protein [Paracoccus sp. SMMA_5_TC]
MWDTLLLIGKAAPLGDSGLDSAIDKRPVDQPLLLTATGFVGDEQADRRVHGGPEKAVHHYPRDHYPTWTGELAGLSGSAPQPGATGAPAPAARPALDGQAGAGALISVQTLLARPGAFGENISATGLTETDVAVGDIFRLGRALVQVSQGRQPCWKLSRRFGVPDMARRVQDSGRTGWYYRVLEPGPVAPCDRLILVDRIAPDWTLHRLWHALYVERLNRDELSAIAALDILSEGWRRYAVRRLESGRVEDWAPRLEGRA